ncbi:Asp23/Gls24 family envelope stress response protein [uncultured Gemmiger sp.]|uniref:Asp23/Gls24 family envelope stress response protein n=1 Tax=uncultured Gemmiger sp. TaxID=1623490 RepID=UPI0025DA4B58|nr:Asp23/Gls24 family envelope stress response protein [uncultured Gemmiger sp.]
MDIRNTAGGSLQISQDVIAKIARLAALEVDGVAEVSSGSTQSMRGLLSKTSLQKDVSVSMKDGVAAVTVHVIPYYGSKVMPVCKKVQENVKQTIQIMTGITVTRVNVVAAGLAEPRATE